MTFAKMTHKFTVRKGRGILLLNVKHILQDKNKISFTGKVIIGEPMTNRF